MSTKQPIWPSGRFGVPQITPFTYRDGHTHLELIEALRDHVVEHLHPSLVATVNSLAEQMEAEYGKALEQYVNGVEEFQRIHDRFMSDVNAQLMALNDTAVSDLVDDETSLLSQRLREVFPTHDVVRGKAITPYMFGATEPGQDVDNTDAIVAMFQHILDNDGGDVYLPPGDWVTRQSGFDLPHGTTISGAGSRISYLRHEDTSNPLFTWGGEHESSRNRYRLTLRDFAIEGNSTQNIFHLDYAGMVQSTFQNLYAYVPSGSSRILYQRHWDFINNVFDNCVFERAIDSINPALDIASRDAANGNQVRLCWFHSHNNPHSPFMKIRSLGAGSYASDWTFLGIVGEQNAGGLLHMHGVNGAYVLMCRDYDNFHSDGYVDDLFKAARSDDGLQSENIVFQNSGRIGSFMSDGAYEFNVDGARNIVVDTCNATPRRAPKVNGEGVTYRNNIGGNPSIVDLVSSTLPPANYGQRPGRIRYKDDSRTVMVSDGEHWVELERKRFPDEPTPPAPWLLSLRPTSPGDITPKRGTMIYDGNRHMLLIHDGNQWRDTMGNVVE